MKNKKKEKTILATSEAIILQCPNSELTLKKDIINKLMELISFASGTYVTWIYEDTVKENKIIATKLLPHKTINYHHRDLGIDTDHLGHCDLKNFLEGVYKNYAHLREKLGLFAVIEYYVSSKSINNLLEINYLVAVTALDCLTSYLSDYFREKNQNEDLSTFKNRLIAVCKEFNITYNEDDFNFIKIQDKIVHTGKFPQDKSPLEEYHNVINFVDRIILGILGYTGEYLNIKNHYKKETFK